LKKIISSFLLCIIIQSVIAQSNSGKPIPADWFKKDPAEDSLAGISLNKAYELLKGRKSNTVIVAVIDNGVDIDHEALKKVIWINPREIAGNGKDDDQNGYIDDIHGWNFRGQADGTIVENELASSLQFYKKWRIKYENADTQYLGGQEKKNALLFNNAKKDYLEKINSNDSLDILFVYNINYSSSHLIAHDSDSMTSLSYGSPAYFLTPNLSHGTHVAGIIAAQKINDTA
jgi:subtilisin family serine protease